MRGAPVRQPRHQPSGRKRVGRRDAQPSAHRARPHRRQHIRESLEAIAHHRKKLFTCRRQLEWARPAAEQGRAAVAFEQLDLMADGRWRHVQLGRCRLEAQMTSRGLEGPQLGERRQFAHRRRVDEINSSCT